MRMDRLVWINYRKGFTLIELLVAMSVMIIITSVSISRFVEYNRKQAGKASIDLVRQAFLEAKSNAVAGKKDCIACGGVDQLCDGVDDSEFDSWNVFLVDDGTGHSSQIIIRGLCDGISYMEKTQTLPQLVTLTGPCANQNNSYGFDGMVVSFPNTCTVTSLDTEFSVVISTTGAVSGDVN